MVHAHAAAAAFCTRGHVHQVEVHGNGNVNDTYLVAVGGAARGSFILQRVNTHVFRQPELIMLNLRTLTDHVQPTLVHGGGEGDRRWVVPVVLPTREGTDYYRDPDGGFWRALSYAEDAVSYETVQGVEHAREAGYALGRFHGLISDLDPGALYDTLPGFHITPSYLAQYDAVVARTDLDIGSPEVQRCARFVAARREWASVLEDARARGELTLRPIHGDPKVNNIMIDPRTGRAVSVVDLDTVKPGLVHYDIGDCLRSFCNRLGEETTEIERVHFDLDLCRAILEGYLDQARSFLRERDYAYLYDAIRLIAFELGLRFFSDHLAGDLYFKVRERGHNLRRALVQFKVTESIEAQEAAIRGIVAALRQGE
ncbi:MAG: aminoglycoside phosphotransferase family protein [Anaerolineae bacterium]|nr:aminoglycoside phosphotransferase family protein [Anaerolineae bacterium]